MNPRQRWLALALIVTVVVAFWPAVEETEDFLSGETALRLGSPRSVALDGPPEASPCFIGVSGGVEPVFALYYSRRSESFGNQIFRVFHSTVSAYLEMHGLMEDAQKKPLEEKTPADYGVDVAPRLKTLKVAEPPKRKGGVMVKDVAELVAKLKSEAKVI